MPRSDFTAVLAAAIDDLLAHGFDSAERVARWTRALETAAAASLISPASMEQAVRDQLAATYRRMVDRGGVDKFHVGVDRFTLERIKPALRADLDRRIMASADLIRLNRRQSIDKTLQRFQGWSTSLPKGGVSAESRAEVKKTVRKSLAQLPFEERRVLIDQGHKLVSSINEVIAKDGGAIAGRWRSNWRQAGYDFREDHKERDEQFFLVRDSWAHEAGLVKKGPAGYTDDVTAPAQEPFCFPGDSKIPFADGIEKAYRRWYSGDLTTIITASGKTLRATPNHPILTPDGWVAIGTLNEGDEVIEASDQYFHVAENYKNNRIPLISEIFAALLEEGGLQSSRKGKLDQFHGDGSDSDVDIIDAARPLMFCTMASLYQRIKKLDFSMPWSSNSTTLRSFDFFAYRRFCAAARFVSSFCQFYSPIFAFAGHADKISLRPISNSHIKSSSKGASRYFKSLRYAQKTFPFKIASTSIVHVERAQWSGHVYNLQTTFGWYVAEGIISHNCRCYYTYIYNLRDLPDSMLTAKGKAALSSVRGVEEIRAARADSAVVRNAGQLTKIKPTLSRATAGYVDVGPDADRLCEDCSMFVIGGGGENSCTLVIGNISRLGTCRHFAAARADSADDLPSLFKAACDRDALKYLGGVRQVMAVGTNRGVWNASFDADRDRIVFEGKFWRKSAAERLGILLHEAGHRGQMRKDPTAFDELKRRGLDTQENFLAMANAAHLADFAKTGRVEDLAGEVFAESYSRICLGLDLPAALRRFWNDMLGRRAAA